MGATPSATPAPVCCLYLCLTFQHPCTSNSDSSCTILVPVPVSISVPTSIFLSAAAALAFTIRCFVPPLVCSSFHPQVSSIVSIPGAILISAATTVAAISALADAVKRVVGQQSGPAEVPAAIASSPIATHGSAATASNLARASGLNLNTNTASTPWLDLVAQRTFYVVYLRVAQSTGRSVRRAQRTTRTKSACPSSRSANAARPVCATHSAYCSPAQHDVAPRVNQSQRYVVGFKCRPQPFHVHNVARTKRWRRPRSRLYVRLRLGVRFWFWFWLWLWLQFEHRATSSCFVVSAISSAERRRQSWAQS